jgi:RNA polymerase sigma-70 factor (ECF subfamily)
MSLTTVLDAIAGLWQSADERSRVACGRVVVRHADLAYRLAYWLLPNAELAEEVTLGACARTVERFGGRSGLPTRACLLRFVREASVARLEAGQLAQAQERDGENLVVRTIAALPVELREVLVLRGVEKLSCQEIAEITGAPLDEVVSRLARARVEFLRLVDEAGERRPVGCRTSGARLREPTELGRLRHAL